MIKKFSLIIAVVLAGIWIAGCASRVALESESSNSALSQSSSDTQRPQSSMNEPTQEPEPSLPPQPEEPPIVNTDGYIDNIASGELFELPIEGATGYAAVDIGVYAQSNTESSPVAYIMAGTGFTILKEEGEMWYVSSEKNEGWVLSAHCMINLPDIIPSIIYDNTNTYSSRLKSSGVDIPNVTGQALYEMADYNDRLGREEFIMPVLYGMAPKIAAAQKAALAQGDTLIIYEAFRPSMAHNVVYENFLELFEENEEVQNGILLQSFTANFFLAPAPYTHQRGTAIDASLAKVNQTTREVCGEYVYTAVSDYTEYEMQTELHELSVASAVFSYPVLSNSQTAWEEATLMESVTEGSILLQKYCTDAGMTPLASEWWHFNDLPSTELAVEIASMGYYWINASHSKPPVA